ncbi:MAG: cohesin domain-containing protein [Candidatus Bathyarchaeia archaeon]
MKRKIAATIAFLLTVAMLTTNIKILKAQATTKLKIVSDVSELGPANATGQTFTVRCVIENVSLLYGVDIQVGWTTEYIEYVSHQKHIPKGTGSGQWPDGILYPPTVPVKDDVDESASMPGAEPGTMYWLAEASMAPAAKFNGTGVAFEMTFRVKKHPMIYDSHIYVNVTGSTLANFYGEPIEHEIVNLHIILHGIPQPQGPTLEISSINYKGPVPHIFDINVSIRNLDPYWDLGGFDIKIKYDPKLLEATKVIADPDGWFASFWSDIMIIKNETNNADGIVWLAVLGIPYENGTHVEPYGDATLCTITFKANASAPIEKLADLFSLAAFPHPERPEPPFNNSDCSVPIPFTVVNGFANIIGITEYEPLPGYVVTIESNSSISSIEFTPRVPLLLFDATGAEGYVGYCNITIPKDFMWSTDGWILLIDGWRATPTITENGQNTYIYFELPGGLHSVALITSNVIPESATSLQWFLTAITALMITITIAMRMKKHSK